MNTKLILITLFVLLSSFMRSQERTEYSDSFTDNSGNWLVESGPEREFEVRNGEYSMNKKQGTGSYMVWKSVPLSDERDWSIEARIKNIDGSKEHGFGLIWNAADADNSNIFQISENGYARVFCWTKGEFSEVIDWRKSPSVQPVNSWNTLKIVHRFDYTAFLVNDVCVGSITTSSYEKFGSLCGFIVTNVMHVVADKFEVRSTTPNRTVNAVASSGLEMKRINLGPMVNSVNREIFATVSADERSLYVARRQHPGNTGKNLHDDIWLSTRETNGAWSASVNMGPPLNNEGTNSIISVAPDNNTLIIQNTYNSDGSSKGGGISISHRTADGWEIPRDVVLDSGYTLNEYREYCLSPDGKVLLSTCEQFDTKGSKDLYVSFRTSDTSFSRPQHIEQLSTMGCETGPFVANDGLTLYFGTNGRAGYGDEDIFVTRRLDSSWMHWTEPKNLGPQINTSNFDAYFRTNTRGDSAYMTSHVESLGYGDIVRIAIPPEAQPQKVTLISGVVYNAKTKKGLGADIFYEFLASNTEAGIARSNPGDGSYTIVLPEGNLYGFRGEAQGFYPVSEQLDTRSLSKYTEIKRDLYLVPIEVNAVIRLNNLFFDFAKYDLRPESYAELDRLVLFLRDNNKVTIEIDGHTDNVGDDKSNMLLSQNRATAVRNYLTSKLITAERLQSKGFGKQRPLVPNSNDEARQQNRRVEFVILKK